MEFIKEYLQELAQASPLYIIGFCFSFISLVLSTISILAKDHQKTMGWQVLETMAGCAANALMGATTGAITVGLACVRNFLNWKNKDTKFLKIALFVVLVTVNALMIREPFDALPMLASGSFTIMIMFHNDRITKFGLIILASLWLIYHIHTGAYLLVAQRIIAIISAIIWFVKHPKKAETESKQDKTDPGISSSN